MMVKEFFILVAIRTEGYQIYRSLNNDEKFLFLGSSHVKAHKLLDLQYYSCKGLEVKRFWLILSCRYFSVEQSTVQLVFLEFIIGMRITGFNNKRHMSVNLWMDQSLPAL